MDQQSFDMSFLGGMGVFFGRVIEFIPILLHALPLTLFLTFVAGLFGLLIGTIGGINLNSRNWLLSKPTALYTFLFRGTPLLVQLYLIYQGVGQLLPNLPVHDTFLWPYLREGLWYALVALSLNQGAYTAEVIRGAIKSVGRGQLEAAQAIGMSSNQILMRITLPLAFRQCLPILTNDLIILLKSTALASTITVMEIMGTARELQRSLNLSLEPLVAAGIIYFVVVLIMTKSISHFERHFTRYRSN
ncbi:MULTISPECIES: ABC transporter permease [unclassified Bartonella]|uniref:ABC transporter permease n=1 Tax=unclassified Bartonella TaxID=2645622 RepID=UPI001FEEDC32|nr:MULTISPECIES: ABC transporter permease subunit [unclassified Bartonella]UXN03502.1 ABC transporter permease subunit [Bartonella sp. HY406]UXN06471.1 ABC transporter permease subunit [Bartonella sp. HY761]